MTSGGTNDPDASAARPQRGEMEPDDEDVSAGTKVADKVASDNYDMVGLPSVAVSPLVTPTARTLECDATTTASGANPGADDSRSASAPPGAAAATAEPAAAAATGPAGQDWANTPGAYHVYPFGGGEGTGVRDDGGAGEGAEEPDVVHVPHATLVEEDEGEAPELVHGTPLAPVSRWRRRRAWLVVAALTVVVAALSLGLVFQFLVSY